MLSEKIYLEAFIKNKYIRIKNNTAQFFLSGITKPSWNFSSLFRDAPDIHGFPTVHIVTTNFIL